MNVYAQCETPAICVMTPDSIAEYIQSESTRGVSVNALRRCKQFTGALYEWLPDEKIITKERLLAWRQNLKEIGYSKETEQNYVKGVNRYLDYMGHPELRFNRGRPRNITGMQFGYLTAIEPTGEKNRKDVVWKCRCKCGREAMYPATRLLTGNALSCGCLRGEHLKEINQYYGGTSLRQSIEERVFSANTVSGYTGVTAKRDKWKAHIKYKGQSISLGCYTKLEDAVKARARGKDHVREEALDLMEEYNLLHQDDAKLPNREIVRAANRDTENLPSEAERKAVLRSDNSSGFAGVHRRGNRWAAKITYQKKTYQLGSFGDLEEAVKARKKAEQLLEQDSGQFLSRYGEGIKEK